MAGLETRIINTFGTQRFPFKNAGRGLARNFSVPDGLVNAWTDSWFTGWNNHPNLKLIVN